MSHRSKAYGLLLVASIIWGAAGPIIKSTLSEIPPAIFLLYRFWLSAIIALFAFALTKYSWPTSLRAWANLSLYCFLTVLGLIFLFFGYDHTSALNASVINTIYPILTAAAGVYFLHEHVTRREKIGMAITFAGTLIIVLEPYFKTFSLNHQPVSLLGNVLILIYLLLGVATALLGKVLLRSKLHPTAISHLTFVLGLSVMLPFTIYHHPPAQIIASLSQASLGAHIGVWYMALFSGTLAYILWHAAQKTIEVGEAAVFSYIYPLITLPLSLFWLKETVTPATIVSCAIIALGIYISETKKSLHRLS
jgi:drug/metabolite transporter (DMT)-like permease